MLRTVRLHVLLSGLLCWPLVALLQAQPVASVAAQAAFGKATGGIEGVVRDAQSGEPLPLVTLMVSGANGGGSSDLDGSFRLEGLAPGKYIITASYLGYHVTPSEPIEVLPGQVVRLELRLTPEALLMGEVVVTAAGRSQAVKLAPASIGVITEEQLRARHLVTFDQAFDEMPGVVVTRSSGANVQAFSIRGASEVAGGGIGNRVLLLIDGRPALSPESGGALWNLVPLSSIERIEVVRGAYSSLYGSSAMGGVVNVITRKPGNEPETRLRLNYGAYDRAPRSTEYSRYNDFYSIDLSRSRSFKKWSYLVDGSWKSDDGHREKTGFDLYNLYTKTTWNPAPNHSLQWSANVNRMISDAPATWFSRRQAYSVAEFKKDDFQDRREFNTDLWYQTSIGKSLRLSSRLYFYSNYSLFTFDSDPGNDSTNVNIGKQIVQQYSVRTRRLGNVSQAEWQLGGHNLIAGVDVKRDYVLGLPDIYLYGEHHINSFGVYAQDELSIGDKITATIGARYDDYHILNEVRESNFSPKLALLYRMKPRWSWRMLLAQAFRDPPVAERFVKFEQGGGLAFRPNPDLRPERLVLSAELGTRIDMDKAGAFDVALFYNRYKNLISFQQVSQPLEPLTYQVINLKESLMQGIELSWRRQWSELLSLSFSYTLLDARDISPERFNDVLAYKVRHTLGASATLCHKGWMLHLDGRYRSRVEEVFIYPGSEPAAALIGNARLSRQIKDRHCMYFAVNNFSNTQYEELERYRMPGRSFAAGVEIGF